MSMGVVIHKHKFCAYGAPKLTYEQSRTTEMVSFSDVVLVVTVTWHSPYESPAGIRLQIKPEIVGKYHTCPLLRCPKYTLLQDIRRQQ
ncbi:hypothetical protein TNCV_1517831 [Trichonephila clavipes]|nr:hypothetical protein TNCV_1517831 [Trichonephila clavipes]